MPNCQPTSANKNMRHTSISNTCIEASETAHQEESYEYEPDTPMSKSSDCGRQLVKHINLT
eukprot:11822303-Prorocentrum_lima.AAC.1